MIKKTILIVFPILVILGLLYYKLDSGQKSEGVKNIKKIPLKIIPNKTQDPQCHMYLSKDTFAVEVITKDYKTHFFDDPGCSILWMKAHNINPKNVTIWTYATDSKKWINAKKAYYSISDFQTPMHYGFAPYEKDRKNFINYNEMRLRMLRGENMTNPKIRKKILQEENK